MRTSLPESLNLSKHALLLEQKKSSHELESNLIAEQRYVFDHITGHILDTSKGQRVSFVTGEGGTAKSRIIIVQGAVAAWAGVTHSVALFVTKFRAVVAMDQRHNEGPHPDEGYRYQRLHLLRRIH